MSESVFLVYCELSGESPSLSVDGYVGAFVTCIVPTDDIQAAIDLARKALSEDGYVVTDVDKAMRFEAEDWEHDEFMLGAVSTSRESGEIAYSEFTVWGH